MTITIIIGLGKLTIGETVIVALLGIAAGMLLDRWAAMVRQREINEQDDQNE
jgi:hypothetical protein